MNENNESYKKVMRKLLSGHIASLKKKKKRCFQEGSSAHIEGGHIYW